MLWFRKSVSGRRPMQLILPLLVVMALGLVTAGSLWRMQGVSDLADKRLKLNIARAEQKELRDELAAAEGKLNRLRTPAGMMEHVRKNLGVGRENEQILVTPGATATQPDAPAKPAGRPSRSK
jgi:hypothetical protein